MQIIIPMSGFGERFKAAGYSKPKPLIKVENKTIIQHVVEMFDDKSDFIFICNEDHLKIKRYDLEKILRKIKPKSKIISIKAHKLGPVHAVLMASKKINLKKPTIINYCDFSCYWDFKLFKKFVRKNSLDGAIPAYKNFHPHSLNGNYYAYLKTNGFIVTNIQEKKPFTNNPMNEYASSGTYYFKTGELMLKYLTKSIQLNLKTNNEYYVSMAYKPMIKEKLNIGVYELEHFMQWGTPEDLKEYEYWSNIFKRIIRKNKKIYENGYIVMPMAGLGNRFKKEGYKKIKPLINVSGNPMFYEALKYLPRSNNLKFIINKINLGSFNNFEKFFLKNKNINVNTSILNQQTDGQATTCQLGTNDFNSNTPITIAACDNGMLYDSNKLKELLDDKSCDIIVWGARHYPGAIKNPEMYGWIDYDEKDNLIRKVSVKKKLNDPSKDHIIIGTFTYKKIDHFNKSVKRMKKRQARVNNEYYIDTSINDAIKLGLKCKVFEVDYYLCWGTPNDLRTYEYWEACFSKWSSHPFIN